MKTFGKTALWAIVAVMFLTVSASPGRNHAIVKEFGKKEVIKICTTSGDCFVRKGNTDKIEVAVVNQYSPRSTFEPQFHARGNTLKLKEQIHGNNSGCSTWSLRVPEGTEVEFESASGDLSIRDLRGKFTAKTASGDVEIQNCRGRFLLSSASGNVVGCGIVIEDNSTFASASGTVNVELAECAKHDLHIGSASGKVMLDYCGNPIRGFFEFTAKAREGRIDSPFEFDAEEKFDKHGDLYVRKIFTRETGDPHITIGTASGRAVLRR